MAVFPTVSPNTINWKQYELNRKPKKEVQKTKVVDRGRFMGVIKVTAFAPTYRK